MLTRHHGLAGEGKAKRGHTHWRTPLYGLEIELHDRAGGHDERSYLRIGRRVARDDHDPDLEADYALAKSHKRQRQEQRTPEGQVLDQWRAAHGQCQLSIRAIAMSDDQPHYLGHRQRLRERFVKAGVAGFADYEVIELLLTLAIPRSDVKQPAKALIARFGNLRGILDAPIEELRRVPGIGSVTPVALQIIRAAATLYLQQNSEGRDSLADTARLADFWRMRIGALQNEVFEVAYLDSAYRLLQDGVETLEEGTIDRAAVYPRRVVEAALKRGAAALVLAHNHPNGNVTPSDQDKVLTRAIVLAADTVHLRVVDHLIVSAQETFSFRKAGLL